MHDEWTFDLVDCDGCGCNFPEEQEENGLCPRCKEFEHAQTLETETCSNCSSIYPLEFGYGEGLCPQCIPWTSIKILDMYYRWLILINLHHQLNRGSLGDII